MPPRDSAGHELDDAFARSGAVGASVATIAGGRAVERAVFGRLDARSGAPVGETTRFQAASISKTANAVAVLILIERGALSIDAPVNACMKRWRLPGRFGDRVTVRHLLSHAGGTNVHGFGGYGPGAPLPGTVQILEGGEPSNSPGVVAERRPGLAYRYSGGGTTVLQALVEELVDAPYEDFLATAVFEPLGMDRSGYLAPTDLTDVARAHTARGNPVRGGHRRHPEKAAAGLWTTPEDVAKLLIGLHDALAGSATPVLSKGSIELMITPVVADAGLGVFVADDGVISHSGANHGFRSYFVFDVRSGDGVVAMSNSERGARAPARLLEAVGTRRGWGWSRPRRNGRRSTRRRGS